MTKPWKPDRMSGVSRAISLVVIASFACVGEAAGQGSSPPAAQRSVPTPAESKPEKYDWNKLSFGGEGEPALKKVKIKIVGDYDKTIFSIDIPEIDVELTDDATLRLVERAMGRAMRRALDLDNQFAPWEVLGHPIGELTLISDERTVTTTIGYGFALDKQYKDVNSVFFSQPLADLIQLQVKAKTGRTLEARLIDRFSGKWLADQNDIAWKMYLKKLERKE